MTSRSIHTCHYQMDNMYLWGCSVTRAREHPEGEITEMGTGFCHPQEAAGGQGFCSGLTKRSIEKQQRMSPKNIPKIVLSCLPPSVLLACSTTRRVWGRTRSCTRGVKKKIHRTRTGKPQPPAALKWLAVKAKPLRGSEQPGFYSAPLSQARRCSIGLA